MNYKSSVIIIEVECGLSQTTEITDRILVGKGTTCVRNSQPWQVALFDGASFQCGGVLISSQWILTAAHCNHKRYWVRLGEHNLRKLDGTEQIRKTGSSVTHPGFQPRSLIHDHDLRLMKLLTPVRITSAVRPLALPTACPTPGTLCLVSGWGKTRPQNERHPDQLQCLSLTIASNNTCHTAFPGKITENMVCAGGSVPGQDACNGDSGGPLVCDNVLQGLVSWGNGCGQLGTPGVYVKICKYLDWIQKTVKKN
ncbi:kallikrein-12-like [Gracilinanus agilis]|uniref:kallikrein-12-like n=1 Tax=Gracilinanus agilis TaxID=191870 RepID=UPI001CFF23C7|nr:kallikrein-12-like [Gracilinanus agilis]